MITVNLFKITEGGSKETIGYSGTPSTPFAKGAVRWNNSSMCFEIDAGSYWHSMPNYVNVDLDERTSKVLNWAEKKMNEEIEFKKLAEINPAVKDLLDTIEIAKQKLEMVKTLTQ